MAVLVIAEHDGKNLKPGTANAVTAATKMGGDVTVLVAGHQCADAAKAAAKLAGVKKVLHADAPHYNGFVAENMAALIVPLAANYSHVVAPATGFGKNMMPRVAAQLDVQQISDISGVVSADTFVRPIYAGNVLATVQSSDKIKVVTVRSTGFDAAGEGGSAPVETQAPGPDAGLAKFNGQELTKSARPELTAAKIIVSGGRRGRRLARGGGFRLRAQRLSGRADRQDRRAGALHRGRHFRRDPAPRGDERQQGHRCHQQGCRGPDLRGRELLAGGRSLQGSA
jgi:electron transfer flavoprotein alpha subunit